MVVPLRLDHVAHCGFKLLRDPVNSAPSCQDDIFGRDRGPVTICYSLGNGPITRDLVRSLERSVTSSDSYLGHGKQMNVARHRMKKTLFALTLWRKMWARSVSEGMWSAFDCLGQSPFPRDRIRSLFPKKKPEEALWEDWQRIGNDFEEAHNQLRRELDDAENNRLEPSGGA